MNSAYLRPIVKVLLRVRLPDGRVVCRQFDSTLLVDDVIRAMSQLYDSSNEARSPRFRLCLFDNSSTRAFSFVDGRITLDSIVVDSHRGGAVALSLLHSERIGDAWTCMNVARALDDCASWLVDSREITAFFGRTAAMSRNDNDNNNKKEISATNEQRLEHAVVSFADVADRHRISSSVRCNLCMRLLFIRLLLIS